VDQTDSVLWNKNVKTKCNTVIKIITHMGVKFGKLKKKLETGFGNGLLAQISQDI
jgi:hypothetical protein